MRVVLTNLSDKVFENSRMRLNESARKYGITEIRSYDIEELKDTSFYFENREILDQPKGIGYWLWKPYIIIEAMKSLSDGDIVLYSDCGIEISDRMESIISICKDKQPVLLFGNGNFRNSTWTKRDCFILMDCDRELYWKGPHCDASFSLFRKNNQSHQFLNDWLLYAMDKRVLTDLPNTCGKRNLPDFNEHRCDQSILSILAQKYQLPLYRMPTQYGNHYKTYPFRKESEFNCISQNNPIQVKHYAAIPYYNSEYPQLLDHHRTKTNSKPIKKNAIARIVRIAGKMRKFINRRFINPF
jgi:hypothetical protein